MSAEVHEVDELVSFAHRTGQGIRVELRLRGSAVDPGGGEVRLRSGERKLVVAADVRSSEGRESTLTFVAPAAELGSEVWLIAFRPSGTDSFTRVRARLLASPAQPVALLPGPAPATRMPAPAPRPRPSAAARLARRLPEPVRGALRRGRSTLRP